MKDHCRIDEQSSKRQEGDDQFVLFRQITAPPHANNFFTAKSDWSLYNSILFIFRCLFLEDVDDSLFSIRLSSPFIPNSFYIDGGIL